MEAQATKIDVEDLTRIKHLTRELVRISHDPETGPSSWPFIAQGIVRELRDLLNGLLDE